MTKLQELCSQQGQSPWLDNLRRDWLADGTAKTWIDRGVRGMTSNPTIFQKAMTAGDAYDAQFRELVSGGASVDDAYWAMVCEDIRNACGLLRGVHDASDGRDGFVSLELAPDMARDTKASIESARTFHAQLAEPNLMIKIPATAEGIPAIEAMIAEGRNINITLIFGIERYREVMEAYLAGLETFVQGGGDPSGVHSVASFFISRVDTEVDRRLESIGSDEALSLRGKAAVAQGKLAYQAFQGAFRGPRWDALAAKGAHVQRPLWASTSTKNPAYAKTLYVDTLIGPDTVNTMPEGTLDDFEETGTLARTVDQGVEDAAKVWQRLEALGITAADVSRVLEDEGVASFSKSFDELTTTLEGKAAQLR